MSPALLMPHHPLTQRLLFFAGIATCHVLAFVALTGPASHHTGPPRAAVAMTTIFLRTSIVEGVRPLEPDLSVLMVPIELPLTGLSIDSLGPENAVSRNGGATVAAPSLKSSVAMEPFARQAALLPGEGATVVLRVEILESGEPGRMFVDTSSGSRQVDDAAMEYARANRWYSGRVDGSAQPMWIRWGIRLQA